MSPPDTVTCDECGTARLREDLYRIYARTTNSPWFVSYAGRTSHAEAFSDAEIPPYIKEKCKYNFDLAVICKDCVAEMETEALRGYPLEDLPPSHQHTMAHRGGD